MIELLNYRVLMSLDAQFARWLHKRLCERFRYAGFGKTYNVSLRSMQRDSGLLTGNRDAKNIGVVEQALDALKEADVLGLWERDERRGPRNQLEDVIYTLHGSMTFNAEQKQVNARHDDIRKELQASGSLRG